MKKHLMGLAIFCAASVTSNVSLADNIDDKINAYVSTWQIVDSQERLTQLQQIFASDATFHDKFTSDTVHGVDGINNMIGNFINTYIEAEQWPIITQRNTVIDRLNNSDSSAMFGSQMSFEGKVMFSAKDYLEFDQAGKIKKIRGFTENITPLCLEADWQQASYQAGDKVTFRRAIYQAISTTSEQPGHKAEQWQKLQSCSLANY